MNLLDKEPVKRVQKLLKEFDPKLRIISLKNPARTALEAASSLGCEVGSIVKSLFLKTEKNFILCLVAGDKKASLNKIKKFLEKVDTGDLASCAQRILRLLTFELECCCLQCCCPTHYIYMD